MGEQRGQFRGSAGSQVGNVLDQPGQDGIVRGFPVIDFVL